MPQVKNGQSMARSCRKRGPRAGNEICNMWTSAEQGRPNDPPVAAAAWPQWQGHEHCHAAQEGQDQDILQRVVEAVAEVANAPLQGEGAPREEHIHQHAGQGLAQGQHDWGLQAAVGGERPRVWAGRGQERQAGY